jgi:ABC-type phosphate/phosphonate transport system permease subunit
MMTRLSVLVIAALLGSTSVFADELNNANKAIEAAKQKTKTNDSPYGDQSMPNTRLTYSNSMNLKILSRDML